MMELADKIKDVTNIQIAERIRNNLLELNFLAEECAKRELHVYYRLKSPDYTTELRNPKITVNIMSEVE